MNFFKNRVFEGNFTVENGAEVVRIRKQQEIGIEMMRRIDDYGVVDST